MSVRSTLLTIAAAALMVSSVGLAATSLPQSVQAQNEAQPVAPEAPGEGRHGGRRHRGPDFAAAAAELGVSEEQLKSALDIPTERPEPDFAAAAVRLGTTEEELRSTMQAARGQGRSSFSTVAEQYNVTPAELAAALGLPAERSRPDFAAAAQELGVSEAELTAALRRGGCDSESE